MAHVFYEAELACAPDDAAEQIKARLAPHAADLSGVVEIFCELEVRFEDLHLPRIGKFSREVRLSLGVIDHRPNAALMPVSWRVDDSRVFPEFHGWLETTPVSPAQTHLAILGDYTPPLGVVGSVIDAIGGNAVAQVTVRRFIDRIRRLLEDERALDRCT